MVRGINCNDCEVAEPITFDGLRLFNGVFGVVGIYLCWSCAEERGLTWEEGKKHE
jgi:hypothetical protein